MHRKNLNGLYVWRTIAEHLMSTADVVLRVALVISKICVYSSNFIYIYIYILLYCVQTSQTIVNSSIIYYDIIDYRCKRLWYHLLWDVCLLRCLFVSNEMFKKWGGYVWNIRIYILHHLSVKCTNCVFMSYNHDAPEPLHEMKPRSCHLKDLRI